MTVTEGPAAGPVTRRRHRGTRRRGTGRAVAGLTWRLTRRGAAVVAASTGVYVVIEAVSYEAAYPDAASRARLAAFGDDPAVRIMQGVPHAVDTVGGFVTWDAGWILQVIVSVWALIVAVRVLRGDEETGRTELVLTGSIRAGRALLAQLAVLIAACLLVGTTIGVAFSLAGAALPGALLFGAEVAGVAAFFVAVAAVAAQVFVARSRAVSVAAAVLGAAVLVRMVANSADSRSWIGWLTPLGWMDQLRPFGDDRWPVLAVPVGVVVVLVVAAVRLRDARDTGAGLVGGQESRRSRLWGLGSPLAFAWRTNLAVLVGWVAGLAIWSLVIGLLVRSVADFIAADPSYRDLLATLGVRVSDVPRTFVALASVITGLVIALFAAWRIGAAWTEEATARLEHLVTRPVLRRRWLGGHVVLMLGSVVLLTAVAATAMWLGGSVTGADLSVGDAFASTFNTVPAVVVFGGLAVLVYGVAPRVTVAVTASVAIATYVLQVVGPMLSWPEAVIGISPFRHLEAVPVDPFGLTAGVVMVAIGIAATVAGVLAFERRDLVGA